MIEKVKKMNIYLIFSYCVSEYETKNCLIGKQQLQYKNV